MHISLSPYAPIEYGRPVTVVKSGDTLLIDGEQFDFSPLPDGATLPAEAIDSVHIVGPVSRIGGELHLTLRLPHGPNPSPAVAFPEPLIVTEDGPIELPHDPEPEQEI